MKKIFLIIGVVVLIGLLVYVLQSRNNSAEETSDTITEEMIAAAGDPLDAVLPFYNNWVDAVNSTTTDPFQAGLPDAAVLTPEVQAYVRAEAAVDPVLCQLNTPPRVGAKMISNNRGQAEVQVLARGFETKVPEYALVQLQVTKDGWRITDISCRSGESGPEREHSFEQSGQLLKSVPEPYNPEYWHLVFFENDTPQIVPLYFGEGSNCKFGETTQTCDLNQLSETQRVQVQGEMTEAGVNVVNVTGV